MCGCGTHRCGGSNCTASISMGRKSQLLIPDLPFPGSVVLEKLFKLPLGCDSSCVKLDFKFSRNYSHMQHLVQSKHILDIKIRVVVITIIIADFHIYLQFAMWTILRPSPIVFIPLTAASSCIQKGTRNKA